jgi:peptide/nickel transport system permease protein
LIDAATPPQTLASRVLRIVIRYPAACAGGVMLFVVVVLGLFAPWLGTVDPTALAPGRRGLPPSAQYWFGTDTLGRDLYSRVLYGARVSLVVGSCVALLSAIIGMMIGVLSGVVRWLDPIVMRAMDGLMSIPAILLAIALTSLTHGSITNVIVAITVVEVPRVARLLRGLVLSIRERPFVEAAVVSGSPPSRVISRHILPNTLAPLMVQATHIFAAAMIIEAILSFIGAGMPPIIPSWGNIMAEGRALWQVKPHIVFIPATFLSIAVLSVNMLGDGLRDALDPHSANRL